jgi:hypothetical protein
MIKNIFLIFFVLVVLVIVGLAVTQFFSFKKEPASLLSSDATTTQQTVSEPNDIPIKVEEITPEVIADTYVVTSTELLGDFPSIVSYGNIPTDNQSSTVDLQNKISQLNPQDSHAWILPSMDGGIHYPYIVSPVDNGICGDVMNYSCQNPTLKIFNSQSNTIIPLTPNGFISNGISGIGSIVYLPEDDTLLVMGNGKTGEFAGKFILYVASSSQQSRVKTINTSSSYVLLFNNFLTSFDSETNKLSVEDLVGGTFNQCTITDPNIQNLFVKNFNKNNVSLSPNGKTILISGDELAWADMSSNCSGGFKIISSQNVSTSENLGLGQWFDDARFFAVTAYDTNAFLFDFNKQYQGPSMSWNDGVGVGMVTNSNYIDTADLGGGYSLKTEVDKSNSTLNLYLANSQGEMSLIKSYQTKLVGIDGDTPTLWVRSFKDLNQGNLFHLLVLDGYVLHQALDVSILSSTTSTSSSTK